MNSQECRMQECLEIEKGNPLVKGEITSTHWTWLKRPDIARDYSESIINFALRVFLNQEEAYYQEANDALYENARYYRNNKIVRDDRDSYYWNLGELVRILFHYGRYGDRVKGLVREDAEKEMVQMIGEYNHDNCRMEYFEYEKSRTWKIHESENHHLQRDVSLWLHTKVMLLYPEIGDIRCADGHFTSEHQKAAARYLKEWICERGRKSLFVECASNVYSNSTIKNVYHIYDFADDEEMRRLAGSLIDLYYATAAQEQFHGCRGGGQGRIYHCTYVNGISEMETFHYCSLGVGRISHLKGNDYTMLDSDYRCPELIQQLARETWERGTYEIYSRPAGLADQENNYPHYSAEKGYGGIVRYSYCTPYYIMGTLHYHRLPHDRWLAISSQNRIQGITFATDRDARILAVPYVEPDDRTSASYNTWFSAQKGSCLITMAIPKEYTYDGGQSLSIWVSNAGGLADNLKKECGWLFTRSGGAYVAICIVGAYYIKENCLDVSNGKKYPKVSGTRICCKDMDGVVILETGDREQYSSMEDFKQAVLKNQMPKVQEHTLFYRSLQEHEFVFGLGKDDMAQIDGQDPAVEIPESYKSPYLNGIWGQPEVLLNYQNKEIRWDFFCE